MNEFTEKNFESAKSEVKKLAEFIDSKESKKDIVGKIDSEEISSARGDKAKFDTLVADVKDFMSEESDHYGRKYDKRDALNAAINAVADEYGISANEIRSWIFQLRFSQKTIYLEAAGQDIEPQLAGIKGLKVKEFTLNHVDASLKGKTLEGFLLRVGGGFEYGFFDKKGEHILTCIFANNGVMRTVRYEADAVIDECDENGKPFKRTKYQTCDEPFYAYRTNLNCSVLSSPPVLLEEGGDEFRNPEDAPGQKITLDYLARELGTMKRLKEFFRQFLYYVYDDPAKRLSDDVPSYSGDRNYAQLASETLARFKEGKLLGDCEDWAFLAREILRKQGKTAQVIYVPGHATCVWVEKRHDNKYYACDIGTYGLFVNDAEYTDDPVSFGRDKGQDSINGALNAVVKKYKIKLPGAPAETSYDIDANQMAILEIGHGGKNEIHYAPSEIFEIPGLYEKFQHAHALYYSGKKKKAFEEYDAIKSEYGRTTPHINEVVDLYLNEHTLMEEAQTKKETYVLLARMFPRNYFYAMQAGDYYRDNVDMQKASLFYAQAILNGADILTILSSLQNCYELLGEFNKIVDLYTMAITSSPGIGWLYLNFTSFLFSNADKLEQTEVEESANMIFDFQSRVRDFGERYVFYTVFSSFCKKIEAWQLRSRMLEEALRFDPESKSFKEDYEETLKELEGI